MKKLLIAVLAFSFAATVLAAETPVVDGQGKTIVDGQGKPVVTSN